MAAGTYELTFDAAQRGNYLLSQQDVQVLVDGVVVDTFTPPGTSYASYTTDAFTVAAGSHTIAFQGLDTIGGDNTALIDDVEMTQVTAAGLSDAGFESPSLGTGGYFEYGPSGTAWTYSSSAGVAGNGSVFTSGNPDAPEGTQVGFLQAGGSFSQVVAGMAAGTYELTFDAAQRGNYLLSQQDVQVLVDGVVVDTFTPPGTSYASYATDAFTVAAGSHTIAFQGLDTIGGDNTALIDDVEMTQVTATTTHLYYSAEGQVIEERQNGTAAADVSHQYVWSLAYVNALVLRDDYQDGVLVPADRLYAQQDANYDTTALVNTSGTVVERYTFTPYGVLTVRDASGTPVSGNTSAFGWQYYFQGGRLDSVTGNVQFAARDYDPTTGVWTQADPLGLGAGDLNDYQFVSGNPAGNVDPSGLAGTPAGGLSSPTAEGWKAFGSSLWGNTFGAIIEEGARLGAPIGTGVGALLYTDIGRAIDLSTTRQRNALAEAAEILPAYVSQRTVDQIAAERANAIGNGLKENVEYAEQVRDGAVAAGELALDVYMIVDGGVAAKRLVSGSTKAAARAVAPNGVTTNLTERLEANASRRLAGRSRRMPVQSHTSFHVTEPKLLLNSSTNER